MASLLRISDKIKFSNMEFLGIKIYDGKPFKPLSIEENLALEKQWFYKFSSDLTCINYTFNRFIFSLDIDWNPQLKDFGVTIIEGPITEGGVFYKKYPKSIEQLKSDFAEAINLIQSFKTLEIKEILEKRIE